MSTNKGLWIDHKEAIIVAFENDKWKIIARIKSNVEKQLRRSGDSPLEGRYESVKVPAANSRQRALTNYLNTYYDEVIKHLRHAGSVLILGPGEAKDELKNRLEGNKFNNQTVVIKTVDSMTDNQIVAKVRKQFVA